jgi:hypothetical protein
MAGSLNEMPLFADLFLFFLRTYLLYKLFTLLGFACNIIRVAIRVTIYFSFTTFLTLQIAEYFKTTF